MHDHCTELKITSMIPHCEESDSRTLIHLSEFLNSVRPSYLIKFCWSVSITWPHLTLLVASPELKTYLSHFGHFQLNFAGRNRGFCFSMTFRRNCGSRKVYLCQISVHWNPLRRNKTNLRLARRDKRAWSRENADKKSYVQWKDFRVSLLGPFWSHYSARETIYVEKIKVEHSTHLILLDNSRLLYQLFGIS